MNIISSIQAPYNKPYFGNNAPKNGILKSSPETKGMHSPGAKTKVKIFYSTDIHCQIPKMERLVTGALKADIEASKTGADYLKVCSGDTFIGSDEKRNTAAAAYLNTAGIDASCYGNHEFDITASKCAELLKNSKTKMLGMNMNFPSNNTPLAAKTVRSYIHKGKSGEKYGIIGLQPSDINERLKKKSVLEGITIDDKEQTVKELKEEVKQLQEKGVNKIYLLSHEGQSFDKKIAQNVSGIDIIFSGHSHELIEGAEKGRNVFYSPAGEPVLIVQAGRDGNHFGLLNAEFDEKGRLAYIQNNIKDTNKYKPDFVMHNAVNSILGKSPYTGELKYQDPVPKNSLIEENPWADFVADALKNNLNADIALINSANFRGSVNTGRLTERDISSIFPFANKLYKVKINEKDLTEAIACCGKSIAAKNSKPGLLQVSGLTYKLDKSGNLKELVFTDKSGGKRNININNPDKNKYYTAVYDEFLIGGGDNLSMLKRSEKDIIEKYPFDKDKITIDYIKSLQQPFEVRKDSRIQIV